MLLLMLLFCVDCKLWNLSKVNYVFIFEFDTRHHLDWRELAEVSHRDNTAKYKPLTHLQLPCFFLLLLGLFLWFNFTNFGRDELFLFYPAILIAITMIAIFLPAPTLFYRSRSWFLYSNVKNPLAFPSRKRANRNSGDYSFPVSTPSNFATFLWGTCFALLRIVLAWVPPSSLTALSNTNLSSVFKNIELFFCLYGHAWNSPDMCSSSHSRVLGFLSTLPGIWRALQCLRRYWDTGNKFPHLANCLKYLFTVLYYISLSVYRLNKTNELFAIFIVLATVNALYCCKFIL
jgi:hypothetical protein